MPVLHSQTQLNESLYNSSNYILQAKLNHPIICNTFIFIMKLRTILSLFLYYTLSLLLHHPRLYNYYHMEHQRNGHSALIHPVYIISSALYASAYLQSYPI